jgi:hypothetical protein
MLIDGKIPPSAYFLEPGSTVQSGICSPGVAELTTGRE